MLPASPTRDAAYGLAALAAPAPLSAESICDIDTVNVLVDDYFMYIRPLVPFPHEPTFREQLRRRDDRTDRSFLALLAGMIEVLVASFPRRPRQLFTSPQARAQFPHAGALIDRCRQVFHEARGTGYLDRDLNIYDAASSYCVAIGAGYTFDMVRLRLYFSETIMILRILGFHRPEDQQPQGPAYQGEYTSVDHVYQQIGLRMFWLCFVGELTIKQMGNLDADILMPPMAHSESLPPLAAEVDDEYITPSQIFSQPPDTVSLLKGFNLNVRIFRAYHAMAAIEMAFGDQVYDWEKQRNLIRRALRDVKHATDDAPQELQLQFVNPEFGEWPPRPNSASQYTHLLNGRRDPNVDQVGLPPPNDPRRNSPYPKKAVQFEIQKANIYATQLATRSYLVERFWNLYEIREKQHTSPASYALDNVEKTPNASSPSIGFAAAGFESRFQPPRSGQTPSDSHHMDAGEQAMALEREDIIRDLAMLLKSINQVNMEPNGQSFVSLLLHIQF